jgi:hypothetical protein
MRRGARRSSRCPRHLSFRTTAVAVIAYLQPEGELEVDDDRCLEICHGRGMRPTVAIITSVATSLPASIATRLPAPLAGRSGKIAPTVFSGWPPTPDTPDILFLLPVPWVGPIWSPVAVSASLVGVGLAAASAMRSGRRLEVARWHWAAGLGGGLLVVLSYTLDAGRLIDGSLPGPYLWPIFAVGILLALAAAVDALRSARRVAPSSTA